MRSILFLLAFTGFAYGGDLTINDQDQQNIQGICDTAAASPALTRELRANLAAWCVAWEKRVQEAAKPKDAPKSAK